MRCPSWLRLAFWRACWRRWGPRMRKPAATCLPTNSTGHSAPCLCLVLRRGAICKIRKCPTQTVTSTRPAARWRPAITRSPAATSLMMSFREPIIGKISPGITPAARSAKTTHS
ncbi:hypothetical protein [Lysobacter gummosus]|uniref:hypothetical protein n=1 Tax=Lysobacter gummosus TaxID=262324 RepID=UPI0036321449